MRYHTTDPAQRAWDIANRIENDLWDKYGPYGVDLRQVIDYDQFLLELAGQCIDNLLRLTKID